MNRKEDALKFKDMPARGGRGGECAALEEEEEEGEEEASSNFESDLTTDAETHTASARTGTKFVIIERPKKALTAYNLFFQTKREEMKREAEQTGEKGHGFSSMARAVAAMWKQLDAEGRACFENLAFLDKQRHAYEMAQWRKAKKAAEAGSMNNVATTASTMPSIKGDKQKKIIRGSWESNVPRKIGNDSLQSGGGCASSAVAVCRTSSLLNHGDQHKPTSSPQYTRVNSGSKLSLKSVGSSSKRSSSLEALTRARRTSSETSEGAAVDDQSLPFAVVLSRQHSTSSGLQQRQEQPQTMAGSSSSVTSFFMSTPSEQHQQLLAQMQHLQQSDPAMFSALLGQVQMKATATTSRTSAAAAKPSISDNQSSNDFGTTGKTFISETSVGATLSPFSCSFPTNPSTSVLHPYPPDSFQNFSPSSCQSFEGGAAAAFTMNDYARNDGGNTIIDCLTQQHRQQALLFQQLLQPSGIFGHHQHQQEQQCDHQHLHRHGAPFRVPAQLLWATSSENYQQQQQQQPLQPYFDNMQPVQNLDELSGQDDFHQPDNTTATTAMKNFIMATSGNAPSSYQTAPPFPSVLRTTDFSMSSLSQSQLQQQTDSYHQPQQHQLVFDVNNLSQDKQKQLELRTSSSSLGELVENMGNECTDLFRDIFCGDKNQG